MLQTYFEFVCFRHDLVPRVQSETHKHKILQSWMASGSKLQSKDKE